MAELALALMGPDGAGKTTLGELLLGAFFDSGRSCLVVDASPDQALSRKFLGEADWANAHATLAHALAVLAQRSDPPGEWVDVLLADAVHPLNDHVDMIRLGDLAPDAPIPAHALEALRYGIGRLAKKAYGSVLIDGGHPAVLEGFAKLPLQAVLVAMPEQLPAVDGAALPETPLHPPAVLVNRAKLEEGLPPAAKAWLNTHERFPLLGKIPDYPSLEARIDGLPVAFRNALTRLDWPETALLFPR